MPFRAKPLADKIYYERPLLEKREHSETKLASEAVSPLRTLEPPESLDEAVALYKAQGIIQQIDDDPDEIIGVVGKVVIRRGTWRRVYAEMQASRLKE